MKSAEEFIKEHRLSADSFDENELLRIMEAEMTRGLGGETSSLAMIPTYLKPIERLIPDEKAIVLDAGGTNFRTSLVTVDDDLSLVISDFKKVAMPGVEREVTAEEFFLAIADSVERLIDKADRIGFCFSYAARIDEDHDGTPLFFSKEIKAPEVIGKKLGENLLKKLSERGHDVSKKRICVLNDTVATLLAAKAAWPEHASSYIGFILGTGTNTAYIEDEGNIHKIRGRKGETQIINIESGALRFEMGDLDKAFLLTTKDSDRYHLEKMISGAYLGAFSALVLDRAIEEGIFSEEFKKRYQAIERLNTTTMSNYLEMPHNKSYGLVKCVEGNEEDAEALYMILKSIIERAGKLTAVNLAAAILKSGEGKSARYPIIINADGTTFYKTEFLEHYTKLYLDLLLRGDKRRYFKFVRMENSPTIGAAIAALGL